MVGKSAPVSLDATTPRLVWGCPHVLTNLDGFAKAGKDDYLCGVKGKGGLYADHRDKIPYRLSLIHI